MANHVHLVVITPEETEPETVMRDFKANASRVLNRRWPRPHGASWWPRSGSRRILPSQKATAQAIQYVQNQHAPLVV